MGDWEAEIVVCLATRIYILNRSIDSFAVWYLAD